jgi:8-oxo-dGTP pyrophosphatase MutT (NUDIX family)
MPERSVQIYENGEPLGDVGYVYICSSYIVEDDKVLLVHHNGFDKWVPPGGYTEPGEKFAETAGREAAEETGIEVEIISSQPNIHPNDDKAVAEPVPFYIDVEYDFKPRPAIVQFFWARRSQVSKGKELVAQQEEVHGAQWFDRDEIATIPTFDQVRSLALFAIQHHPDSAAQGHSAH